LPQTQQALSQIASRLEKLGYLERKLIPAGRGVGLHITDSGETARVAAHEAIETFEASLAQALGAERHQRLVRLLAESELKVRDMAASPRRRGHAPSTTA
jgi:DNA-binding MarR family transcriptional regulator